MSLFHDISQRKRPKDIDLSIKKDSANRRSPLIIQDFVVSDDSADIDVEKSRYTNSFFDKAKRMIVCFGKVTYAFLDGFLQALSHWGRSTVSMYLVKKENNQKDFWGTSQQAVWSQKRQSSRKALYKAKDLFVPFFFLVFLSFSYQAVSVGIQVSDIVKNSSNIVVDVQIAAKDIKNISKEDVITLKEELAPVFIAIEDLWATGNYFYGTPSYLGYASDLKSSGQSLFEILDQYIILRNLWESKQQNLHFTDLLVEAKPHLDIIYKHIEDSSAVFSLLDVSFFPEKYQPVLRELQSVFYYFEGYKQYYVDYYDLALELLGEKDLQRYLFVFQNSAEIRPTGGFIGSLMLLDFLDGVYTQTPIDVYKLDGQLTEKIPIPYGLQKVAENFYLRDSNYWPDFPQSAEQISWFLEKEWGPSIDHIIAFDQRILAIILRFFGEVDLPKYDATIDQYNYYYYLVGNIESKNTDTDTPKQILFDLISVIQQRFEELSLKEKIAFVQSLIQSAEAQLYSENPRVQSLIQDFGFDGAQYVPGEREDFVEVVHTSIGGNKSDYYINERLQHYTNIHEDGSLQDMLTIVRQHNWTELEKERWESYTNIDLDQRTDLRFVFGDAENVSYTRVYLPKWSRVDQILGLDPSTVGMIEQGPYLVVFFHWSVIPGDEKTVRLRYTLPWTIDSEQSDPIYSFSIQKQMGMPDTPVSKTISSKGQFRDINKEFLLTKDPRSFQFPLIY